LILRSWAITLTNVKLFAHLLTITESWQTAAQTTVERLEKDPTEN